MKYNFDENVNRRGTYSMKWDGGELFKDFGMDVDFNEKTIPIFTADMDLACPQPVIDALHAVVDHRIFGYTSDRCEPKYRQAIIRWFKDHHNWDIKEEEILYVNGTVEALNIAVRCYTKEGDGILITRPVYGPFTMAIENNGRKVVNSQMLCSDGYYTMDFDDIEQKAKDPNTTMFILCSPHNPTGRVWTPEELQQLAAICKRNNVILVTDEVHCDILRKGVVHHPVASVVEDTSNIITLTAVNKTFNLAGLQCSNAIIPNAALRETYQKALGMRSPTPFAIAALIAAYTEGDEWLAQVNEYIDGTMDWVLDFMAKEMPKVKIRKPEGTYVLWMDFRAYGLTADEIHDKIYKKANVVLEGGGMFDPDNGAGFERVCLPSPRPLIQEAFQRIAAEFKGL